jgi:hypothetical protein
MTGTAWCPVCDEPLPARSRPHGGRRLRYCSDACKAKAYRARQQPGEPTATDPGPLPPGARHARAVEIRQQANDLIAALADTASGQQSLFATPGTTRRTRPAQAGQALHRLITELTTLATTATTVTKRTTKRRPPAGPPQAPPLLDEPYPGHT